MDPHGPSSILNARATPLPPTGSEEARCECGHLVAKLRADGVELKCKRCKRLVVIPFAALER